MLFDFEHREVELPYHNLLYFANNSYNSKKLLFVIITFNFLNRIVFPWGHGIGISLWSLVLARVIQWHSFDFTNTYVNSSKHERNWKTENSSLAVLKTHNYGFPSSRLLVPRVVKYRLSKVPSPLGTDVILECPLNTTTVFRQTLLLTNTPLLRRGQTWH